MVGKQWFPTITACLLCLIIGVRSRYPTYRTRAQKSCYVPRGEQYERGYYSRISRGALRRVGPGVRMVRSSRILVACKKDIQHDAIMTRTISRCIYGTWQPKLPSCIVYRCGDIPKVADTTASEKPDKHKTYPNGYVVQFACAPDQVLRGDNKVTCLKGRWTEPAFTCEAPLKAELCRTISVENADVILVASELYQVTCAPGYVSNDGGSTFKCVAGEWVTKAPRCVPNQLGPFYQGTYDKRGQICPNIYYSYDILQPRNDSTSNENARDLVHGVSVRIKCPTGQQPYKGVVDVRCDDGKWKPRRPVCRKNCRVDGYYRPFSRYTFVNSNGNVGDVVSHGIAINQRCLGDPLPERRLCIHGRWRPLLKRCSHVEGLILPEDSSRVRSGLYGEKGCPLIEAKSEFLSLDGTISYDSHSIIDHGTTIKQVCEDDKDDPKSQHIAQCDEGAWSPDLIPCPDKDCDVFVSSRDLKSGTIASLGQKLTFPRNTICTYHFEMDRLEKVKITFKSFEISGRQPNCSYGYLAYNSSDKDGPITRLCGNKVPSAIELYGPEVLITWNTYKTEVAQFQASFEILSDEPNCLPPPNEIGIVYEPTKSSYNTNDVIQIVGCRNESSVLIGSDRWYCQANGTWNASGECTQMRACDLPKKNGILYQIGENTTLSGSIPHGRLVTVFSECSDVIDDVQDMYSHQLIGCKDGTLTDDVIECPNDEEGSGSDCVRPFVVGVHLSPEKDVYKFSEKVKVTGCNDDGLSPVGARELVCLGKGKWYGSVQCLNYCENGAVYPRETEYSYFIRQSNVRYHQIKHVETVYDCLTDCEMHEDFTCRSFEYRDNKSMCILLDSEPNAKQFGISHVENKAVSKVYNRACDDRCHIPDPKPTNMLFFNEDENEYEPRQAVLTGSILTVTCENKFKIEYMTCIGGAWDVELSDEFCL